MAVDLAEITAGLFEDIKASISRNSLGAGRYPRSQDALERRIATLETQAKTAVEDDLRRARTTAAARREGR